MTSHQNDMMKLQIFTLIGKAKTKKLIKHKNLLVTLQQMRNISQELESHDLHTDPVGLFDFLQAGIEQREEAKFHFTRNLSQALSLICKIGEKHDISRGFSFL